MQNKKSASLQREKKQIFSKYTQNKRKINDSLIKKTNIVLGVCAMKKKVQSKPMRQILSRIACKEIEIIEMWQYLDKDWTTWPIVDALICFHSDGFPFLMAWKYVKKHKPYLINNLDKQQLLWDRTVVYDILKKMKVPIARHFYIFKDMDYIGQIQKRGYGTQNSQQAQTQKAQLAEQLEAEEGQKKRQEQKSEEKNEVVEEQEVSNLQPLELQQMINGLRLRNQFSSTTQFNFGHIADTQSSLPHLTLQKKPFLLRHYVEKRNPSLFKLQVREEDDYIIIRNENKEHKLKKPFVEKPFDSQNHEICIYYPKSMGGGRKTLFRKINDCSSLYDNNQNSIRTDGNYIYEEFLPTNAFDIKVYTIGPYYMYAEARRSPTLDGVVQRNSEGKEQRYPVILTPEQKFICNKIVQEFQQEVCGFDLLRANGKSYVCDVNGWSFVKSNPKYWQDCSIILKKKILNHFFPEKYAPNFVFDKQNENMEGFDFKPSIKNLSFRKTEELRSIVSIFRHGDRSPKLKLKIKTLDQRFIDFFQNSHEEELKFKDGTNLTKFLEITIQKIAELDDKDPALKDYLQMKMVLESGGNFEGFNRKIQLKVLQRQKQEGQGRGRIRRIMIVLKWGGQLSYMGYLDAIQLGKKMRMQRYDEHDCLSLYSSYRHDVKTYSSDEGRCIKTAAAFLKGFLSIEGELVPIISSMVKAHAKAQKLLDCTSYQNHSLLADQLQERLSQMMNSQEQLFASYLKYCPEALISYELKQVIIRIGKPRQTMSRLQKCLKYLSEQLQRIYLQSWEQKMNEKISNNGNLMDQEKCESILLMSGRWQKLKKEFYDKETNRYNISKIPDIYDTIRHDLKKNTLITNQMDPDTLQHTLDTSKTLAYFVVINEYGASQEERIRVAKDICLPLLEKILIDLNFWKEPSSEDSYWKYRHNAQLNSWRHIRTRLYFSSASHMYSLFNILILGNSKLLINKTPPEQAEKLLNILYMGYLSHIEFRLYENLTMDSNNFDRFRLQISLSTEYRKDKEMKQFSLGGSGLTINEITDFIKFFIGQNNKEVAQYRKNSY